MTPTCCRRRCCGREAEGELTQGTCCSIGLCEGRRAARAEPGTLGRCWLPSRRHSPWHRPHSCHSSTRATCLGDRRRHRSDSAERCLQIKGREEQASCAYPRSAHVAAENRRLYTLTPVCPGHLQQAYQNIQ